MGVDRTDYVMIAASIDGHDYNYARAEAMGYDIVVDELKGEYAYVGKVVASAGTGWPVTDISELAAAGNEIMAVIAKVVDDYPHLGPHDFRMVLFSQFY